MNSITSDDVKRLARAAHMAVDDAEAARIAKNMGAILKYAERLNDIVDQIGSVEPLPHNVNVVRPDVAVQTDVAPLLAQAPEMEERFFVVPRIIKASE